MPKLLTIALTTLTLTATPATTTDRPTTPQHLLNQATTNGGVPGIVAHIRRPGHTWFGTAGVADLTTKNPRKPGEHFRIGSLTKAFTATITLQLAAEHTLTLDDTVAHWLPGTVEQHTGADGTAITIRQLLNHTSGLPDTNPGQPTPKPQQPGKHFIYSKLNYTLAGMIIEKATGTTLTHQITHRITRPLKLTATHLPTTDPTIPDPHPKHYTKTGDTIHDATTTDVSWAWAAGGMISTTDDLHRFLTALLRGRLLPPAQQRDLLTTVPTGTDWIPNTRYGLGIFAQTLTCGRTVWGGGGAITGSWTYAMANRQATHTLVTNTNGDWNNPLTTFTALLENRYCPPAKKTP
ncbi:serine hydrolase domain-containing protein [Nonomuraea longicatena]|uniref:Serine hydrolase domain-containing protein n=1 Tax=Nonomuraea longicatena TaxID=83682 RepID=A0ABP4BLM1_9ACTN